MAFKKLIYAALAPMAFAMASCGGASTASDNYLCVQTEDSKLWSILNVGSGEIVKADEFQNPTSNIVDGAFFVANSDGKFDIFTLDNTSSALNKSPFDATSGFNKNGFAIVLTAKHPVEVVDTKGQIIATLPTNIQPMNGFADNDLAPYINSKGQYGFINTKGESVIAARYVDARPFSDGVTIVKKESDNEKSYYAVIDGKGEELFAFNSGQYSDMSDFTDGYAFAVQGDQVVLLDKTGTKVAKVSDSRSVSNLSIMGDKFTYTDGSFYGVKDTKGEILIRAKYQALQFLGDGNLLAVNQNDKFGVISINDDEVMPFQYNTLKYLMPNRYITRLGSSYVLIDNKEKELCKVAFDKIDGLEDNVTAFSSKSFLESAKKAVERATTIVNSGLEDFDIDFTQEELVIPEGVQMIDADGNVMYENLNGYPTAQPYGAIIPISDLNSVDGYDQLTKYPISGSWIEEAEMGHIYLAKNAIYAIHGYKFKDEALYKFFSQFAWYQPTYDDVTSMLSPVEVQNIELLKEYSR